MYIPAHTAFVFCVLPDNTTFAEERADMTKKELRRTFRTKRTLLSAAEMERLNNGILKNFQQIPLPVLSFVHSFVSSPALQEPDTSRILDFLVSVFPELQIAVPKVDAATLKMTHHLLSSYDNLVENIYGINEPLAGDALAPTEMDLVLIPMLGFDENGYRVGFGKGYYDRFLAECRPDVIKVGLSFFQAVPKIEDINEHDIPMNFCCTPYHLYRW